MVFADDFLMNSFEEIHATTVWGEAPLISALTSPSGRGFPIFYLSLFPKFAKINIYVKRFDPRNFEKPNITLPRLETDVRSTHSALFPKILKVKYKY